MKASVSEFIQISVGAFYNNLPPKKQIVVDVYLDLLERCMAEAIDEHTLKRSEEQILHQFENVLLRINDPKKWRTFLYNVCKRKGWSVNDEISDSAPEWIRDFCRWLPDKDGIWQNNKVDECIVGANGNLYSIYYSDNRQAKTRLTLSEDEWNELAEELYLVLRTAVLRELMLRLVVKALC